MSITFEDAIITSRLSSVVYSFKSSDNAQSSFVGMDLRGAGYVTAPNAHS